MTGYISASEVKTAAEYVKNRAPKVNPRFALVLGSGLGSLADEIEDPCVIPFGDIPGFKPSTAPGQAGVLLLGTLAGQEVVCMKGRLQLYEGYSAADIAFTIRVMAELGAMTYIPTNAAGGINFDFEPGDIMLITDHINMSGANPLTGKVWDGYDVNGAGFLRFPDMTAAYTPALLDLARDKAYGLGISLKEGVYLCTPGPCFETPAEIRAFRALGADAVGMSTVPEVIAAAELGMNVLGFSIIANKAAGMSGEKLSSEEVNAAADASGKKLAALIKMILGEL